MMKQIALLFVLLTIMTTVSYPQHGKPVRFLALGDSYTIGESIPEKGRWPVQLADSLNLKGRNISMPKIIATTGWRTDDLMNAIADAHLKNEYDLVGLLIGVNNQYQGKPLEVYESEFETLLKTAITLAQGKKENVFVVSIPDYGFTPFGAERKESISIQIDEFNKASKTITLRLGVRYVNITDISRDGLTHPDLVAGDRLHPSAKQYSKWVHRIIAGMN